MINCANIRGQIHTTLCPDANDREKQSIRFIRRRHHRHRHRRVSLYPHVNKAGGGFPTDFIIIATAQRVLLIPWSICYSNLDVYTRRAVQAIYINVAHVCLRVFIYLFFCFCSNLHIFRSGFSVLCLATMAHSGGRSGGRCVCVLSITFE